MSKSVFSAEGQDKYKIRIPYVSGNVDGNDELWKSWKKFLLSKMVKENKSKETTEK